jgi:predicted 2-oxoglutarate/Fe(II)-dependent dioxygenase YbiX
MDIIVKPEISWNLSDKIFIKEDFLSNDMCDELIEYGNCHVKPGVPQYSKDTNRLKFNDCMLPAQHHVKDVFEKDWEEIVKFHGFDVDFIEPYVLKRYKTSDFFNEHPDNFGASRGQTMDRKFTTIVQLSNETDYKGGIFSILGKTMPNRKGTLISFPSFYMHGVSLVTSGARWSLINWAWGPYWK